MRNGNLYFSETSSTTQSSVLTVPMRNGNRVRKKGGTNMAELVLTVPMRNGNLPTDSNRKLTNLVLTVPMRNGNKAKTSSLTGWLIVLTVPMRNGNNKNAQNKLSQKRSYRTYEEWKLVKLFLCPSIKRGSYRTYEEWKQHNEGRVSQSPSRVLTVPMRNGNSSLEIQVIAQQAAGSYRTYEEWKHFSPTYLQTCQTSFLPYLWGMETFRFNCCSLLFN